MHTAHLRAQAFSHHLQRTRTARRTVARQLLYPLLSLPLAYRSASFTTLISLARQGLIGADMPLRKTGYLDQAMLLADGMLADGRLADGVPMPI